MTERLKRCPWCEGDPLYELYHDNEWGVPVHNDSTLFENLTLEGAQAGLSWITVLRKRTAYRQLFADFDIHQVAKFPDQQLETILLDPNIIRHRLKVYSTRKNAQAILTIQREFGSFDEFLWRFVNFQTITHHWQNPSEVPTTTATAIKLSKALKKYGFSFVGPTIIYAFMQASGMVNDHLSDCHRYQTCIHLANS